MNRNSVVAVLACLSLLAGCAAPYSEAPLATNFPATKQQKLQAASHWNVIAGDVARQISAGLGDKRALHVTDPASARTTFEKVFITQLISALVAEGFPVQKTRDGALSVEVDTQAVRFTANRPQYKHVGAATALMTGIWVLHSAEATAGAVLYAGVAAADAHSWFQSEFATGETPKTEIVVTTSVSDGSRYLARNTNVYYVADDDSRMYEPLQTKRIGVVGL